MVLWGFSCRGRISCIKTVCTIGYKELLLSLRKGDRICPEIGCIKLWKSVGHMELDLQSIFGLHMHNCTHWLRPRNPPPLPPHLDSSSRALLVNQDRRHLFATPCGSPFHYTSRRYKCKKCPAVKRAVLGSCVWRWVASLIEVHFAQLRFVQKGIVGGPHLALLDSRGPKYCTGCSNGTLKYRSTSVADPGCLSRIPDSGSDSFHP